MDEKKKKKLREILAPKPKTKKSARQIYEMLADMVSNYREIQTLVVHFSSADKEARRVARLLIEGGKTVDFDNRYSVRKDRAHVPGQSDHVHVLLKGTEVCVINMDGTPSHGSDLNRLTKGLRSHLRDMGVNFEEGYLLVEATDVAALAAILRSNIRRL